MSVLSPRPCRSCGRTTLQRFHSAFLRHNCRAHWSCTTCGTRDYPCRICREYGCDGSCDLRWRSHKTSQTG